MKKTIIKLGSVVRDRATGLSGMFTHLQVELDGREFYNFQPKGLNPEDGQPVKRAWLVPERVKGAIKHVSVDLPLEVLGSQVEDEASGFAGMVTALTLHISGCVHVHVQPKGILPKTGATIEPHDFDIRRLKGSAIKAMTEAERDASQAARPSPGASDRYSPRS